ncbi:MAG: hypothetical protein E2O76_17655 [Caldithrix sp.]|nr:MAG: hypothetical protein E2O76_17655 [Caldithrix sp.]
MTYKRQKAVLFTFLIAAISFHGSGCSQESKKESAKEEAETVQVEGTYKYKLLDDLGNANIITKNVNDVGKRKLTINGEERTVLFEHPNSEVAFRDIVINKNTQLKFGIGIEERAWDKRGDGVFFEICLVDEKLRNTLLFLEYIDPKNHAEYRGWLDEQIDLSAFAGQKVILIFKTTSGPKGNADFDWAGWSNPELSE